MKKALIKWNIRTVTVKVLNFNQKIDITKPIVVNLWEDGVILNGSTVHKRYATDNEDNYFVIMELGDD